MTLDIGIVMDPINTIKIAKDSSFAMLLEAQRRHWSIHYMEMDSLYLENGQPMARTRILKVCDDPEHWFEFENETTIPVEKLNAILMRKDPPFDMEYIYATYLLEQAEARGTLVVNRPQALRDANEKLFTSWFPQCTPDTLVSRCYSDFSRFLARHGDIILKPLGGMGGESIFRVKEDDPNINVILETLTARQTRYTMAQKFIPEISNGDKRILVVNGEAVPWALARVPRKGETRGNLAAGGSAHGTPLGDRDHWIVEQVAPRLKEAGILFAGLDVIGDYLTEINVTSPTCIRELDSLYNLNISGMLMDSIENKIRA
ncbi:glutathione synthase [Thiolapillus brandeum]|uniref:Glutathione synthetase n=1 Tax=Thiolapillus brandeum TaxID=1076588 RepID=A0A7U6GKW1_9GAMM|nr:glutathione synthase [Thiolapillus brandeum]BAO45499.1 glutathione synthetase [Thiolapillus brandeum]